MCMTNDNDRSTTTGVISTSPRVHRRSFLRASGVGALAITAGCTGGGDGDGGDGGSDGGSTDGQISGTIKIGSMVPLPGEFAGGTAQKQAVELKAKQLNDDGGLLGADVEVVTKDTKLDPSTALDRYRELQLEEEVDVTVGLFGSEPGLRVAEEVKEHQNVLVLGGVSTTDIEQLIKDDYEGYKYVFRAMNNGVDFGRNLGRHAQEMWSDWGYEKIGVAVEDIEGWRAQIQPTAMENLPDGVEVAFTEVFSSDTKDFSPILNKGESEDIDFLFSFLAHGGSALTIQWGQKQPNYAIGGADVFSGMPAHYEKTDGAVEYVWTYVPGSGPGFEFNQSTSDFINATKEEYGSPPPHSQAYTMYDAITSWVNAVQETGTTNEDDIVEYMEKELAYEATTGFLEYREKDHEFPHSPKYGGDGVMSPMIQWQEGDGDGKQVGLWPDRVKSGEYQHPPWVDS